MGGGETVNRGKSEHCRSGGGGSSFAFHFVNPFQAIAEIAGGGSHTIAGKFKTAAGVLGNIEVVDVCIVDALDRTPQGVEAAVVSGIGVPLFGAEIAGDVFGDLGDGEVAETIGGYYFGACGDGSAGTRACANGGDEFATDNGVAVGGSSAVAVFDPFDATGGGCREAIRVIGRGGDVPCGAVPLCISGDRGASNLAEGGLGFGNQLPGDRGFDQRIVGIHGGDRLTGVRTLGHR